MDILLRHKIREWGCRSNGLFQMAEASGGGFMFSRTRSTDWCGPEGSFASWRQAELDPQLAARVKWGSVKSMRRATEKLYRSYDCDVSRLLDCCRQVSGSVVSVSRFLVRGCSWRSA